MQAGTTYTPDKNYVETQTDARAKVVTMATDAAKGTISWVKGPDKQTGACSGADGQTDGRTAGANSRVKSELEKPLTFSQAEVMKYFDALSDLDSQSPEMKRSTVRRYIEKVIIKEKTVDVESTFTVFVGNSGSGGVIPTIPTIFLYCKFARNPFKI